MKESLVQHIWQHQLFDKGHLRTTTGEPLRILRPGRWNGDAGPDFEDAELLLGPTCVRGAIEIHVRGSGWHAHKHHQDPSYDKVVLHVVWEHPRRIVRPDGSLLPTLTLKERVPHHLLATYASRARAPDPTPYAAQAAQILADRWPALLEKALLQRLDTRYQHLCSLLRSRPDDAEATCYQLLCCNLGFKTNAQPCWQLSQVLPCRLLQEHSACLLHLEALLLGQAGLLPDTWSGATPADAYLLQLITTYQALKRKHRLSTPLRCQDWKFFRVRPSNFPFIRLTQLASLLHQHPSLWYLLLDTPAPQLYQKLAVRQSLYWQKHYRPGKPSPAPIPGLGKGSIHNILINTVVPLLVAYGRLRGEAWYLVQALELLRGLPAEDNSIIRRWQAWGRPVRNALESQGCLELHKTLCRQHQEACGQPMPSERVPALAA